MAFKRIPLVALSLLSIVIISCSLVLYVMHTTYSLTSFNIIRSEDVHSGRQPKFTINNHLVQLALNKINEDRMKFNLKPVQLSENQAAQFHAEDLLKTKYPNPSHLTSDGMKPYIKYSTYNGTGYVQQNIAIRGYDNGTVEKCENGTFSCYKLDPYAEINNSQWKMVYNDTICCNDSHKYNILDKYHTHVSLGIAYDDYYFAFVQNFENNYLQFNKPLTQDNRHIQISGTQLENNNTLDSIGVYYDEMPSHTVYQQNKDKSSYELGTFIASIVKPPPLLFRYDQPSNYTLIEADNWTQDGQSLDINFDLSSILKEKGVYTIILYSTDEDKNKFPVASYSLFF